MLREFSQYADAEAKNRKEWKSRILKQWEESKKLPRKKKKAVRKKLNLEWGIASWTPFPEYNEIFSNI